MCGIDALEAVGATFTVMGEGGGPAGQVGAQARHHGGGPNDTAENGRYTGDSRELAQVIPDEIRILVFVIGDR